MIETVKQGLEAEGIAVPMTKLCQWFEVPRRSVYYKPAKSAPKVQERLERPIKALIEQDPSYGYRTVAGLLNMNKNTVQRIFQIRGWQVKKLPIGFRPRVEALPSVAVSPDQRWATDLCRIWAGRDGWVALALVIDCYTRELLGWHLSRSGKARTAEAALEQALIARFGTLGRVKEPFLLRSDNGLVFHQPKLHSPGEGLRIAAGVHRTPLPATKRDGRACNPNLERAVCSSSTV